MANTQYLSHLFISYSHKNEDVMRRIRGSLQAAGLVTWTDEHLVPGTEDWELEIEKAIEAAWGFILILTPESKASEWCRRERHYADLHEIEIFPVLTSGDGKQSVPLGMTVSQWIDIRDTSYYQSKMNSLIVELKNHLKIRTSHVLTAEEFFQRASTRDDHDQEGKIADYTEAVRLNNTYAEAYKARGVVREELNDSVGAFVDYDQAVRFHPEDSDAYAFRGHAQYRLGNYAAAIDDLTKAVQLDPDNWLSYFYRGCVRAALGEHVSAIANLTEAIRLNPMDAEIFAIRGVVRAQQDNIDGAIADCSEAIRIDAYCITALNCRAKAYFKQSEYEKARQDFDKVMIATQGNEMARAGLSVTLSVLGYRNEARIRWHILRYSDPRYLDADWVGRKFEWSPEMVDAARQLIAELPPT